MIGIECSQPRILITGLLMESNILSADETERLDAIAKAFELEIEEELQRRSKEKKTMANAEVVKKIVAGKNIIDDSSLSTARFSKAEWFEKIQQLNVMLVGVGGIGSNAAYTIAHLHPSTMLLMDGDKVDEVNLAGQYFDTFDIGNKKVNVMKRKIACLHCYNVVALERNFEPDDFRYLIDKDIVVAGFDNMDARKILFDAWVNHGQPGSLFIDGRMSVNVFQLFAMRHEDKKRIKKYKDEWLFDQEESESNVCSYKQTYFCATMMSGVITSLIINYAQNLVCGEDLFPLPFFVEEDTTLLLRRIENDA